MCTLRNFTYGGDEDGIKHFLGESDQDGGLPHSSVPNQHQLHPDHVFSLSPGGHHRGGHSNTHTQQRSIRGSSLYTRSI